MTDCLAGRRRIGLRSVQGGGFLFPLSGRMPEPRRIERPGTVSFGTLTLKTCWHLLIACVFLACTPLARGAGKPFLGTYVNINHLCEADDPVPTRERVVRKHLDRIKASGIDVVMPYATTTSGAALYPSDIVPTRMYSDWDPLRLIMKEAAVRGLRVYPVPCVLACGKDKPAGILVKYPEWAIRKPDGRLLGHISPGHPGARTTSQKRCKMRCSTLPFCLARGRNPICPRIRKPLFCRGLRPGARWCNPVEWRIGDSNLVSFPAGIGRCQGRENAPARFVLVDTTVHLRTYT